jgi:hypothetical protein
MDNIKPPRYHQWLTYVFDRSPASNPALDDVPFQAEHAEVIELITYTMLNCGRDLVRFSDGQVSVGLDIIFNNSYSDYVFSIKDSALPAKTTIRAITSLKALYSDCFEPRCAPILSHQNEAGHNSLNGVCYMLWDVTPLAYWEDRGNKELFYGAVLEVLESALECENEACIESALHGLGHLQLYCKNQAPAIISRYLKQHPNLRRELVQYASDAALGHIL